MSVVTNQIESDQKNELRNKKCIPYSRVFPILVLKLGEFI